MNVLKAAVAATILFGFVAPVRAETCGQMIASQAVLPATMSKIMTAVSNMFEAHADIMLAGKTPEGKKEAALLKTVAKQHRDLATGFNKAADTMKKAVDLPAAEHDMAKMQADPKLSAAMKDLLALHKEMVALLQKEIAQMESMPGKK